MTRADARSCLWVSSVNVRGGGRTVRGARTPCPPSDLTKYFNDEIEPPYAPPCAGANVESRDEREEFPKYYAQPMRSQRSSGCHGLSGSLLNSPPRRRQPRDLRIPMDRGVCDKRDGEEAALWDEVSEVLRCCGVNPEGAGRSNGRLFLAPCGSIARGRVRRSERPVPWRGSAGPNTKIWDHSFCRHAALQASLLQANG